MLFVSFALNCSSWCPLCMLCRLSRVQPPSCSYCYRWVGQPAHHPAREAITHSSPWLASASGLLYVAEVIEEHAGLAKTIGQRTIYVSSSPIDHFPQSRPATRRVASFPSLLEKILRADPFAWDVHFTLTQTRHGAGEVQPEGCSTRHRLLGLEGLGWRSYCWRRQGLQRNSATPRKEA